MNKQKPNYNITSWREFSNFQIEADTILRCFEKWLGPYPFYEDSYKVVEAPFIGMEHQSAIAYGNNFEPGYVRGNLSGTEWGLKWDFVLMHESGHEWFGNSITAHTYGESWIHEGFTKYLETIYTSYVYGNEAGNDYTIGIWKKIKNDKPILGTGTSDTYNKGRAMLHMVRQIIGDTAFMDVLHGLNKTFFHHTVSTAQILNYINRYTKHDFSKVFDQYLTTIQVPELDYYFDDNEFFYQWLNCVEGFDMPVKVSFNSQKYQFIYPTIRWQKLTLAGTAPIKVKIDRNFYVKSLEQKK